ncbi:J domain-containing protein [Cardiobacterium valvarum]|uniref:DnaJ domain protein n=1 Tax=Cardiobacterium valvarum F0432 TaxID=797473 RepID=G9ZD89_9GAMM|nr:J domain-containing protein [Cardiobacterium valvarum]EHM55490.1 DnaJ domain protein [Cardiobacterium valvarum F0432]
MNCWQTLGIAPTGDEAVIKTAYAALIRQHRPDRDPAGFRRVRAAFEEALSLRHHYENRRDEPRRPTGWMPGKPPVAADDSDENSISRHDPGQPYPLAEPAAHDYRDTPPAAPEQPYPLSEPAAHDHQDGNAQPTFTPLEATVLLRQLQQAWQGQDDAQLLAILQSQAAHPALESIDFRLDYIAELLTHLDGDTYPRSNLWVQQHYEQHDPDDDRQLNEYIAAYCRQWEEAINDSELCRTLQQQAADPVLTAIAVRDVWLAALVDYLTNSLARPRSYYWARTRYPSAFPDTIPLTYRDYPSERIATFTRALLQAADDAALTALLKSQAADPILAYPPARSQYLARLAEQRPDWCDRPDANRWLDEHYTLPHIDPAARQSALLAHLQQEWQGKNDDRLLAILQAQATLPSLEHIDLRSDYTAALQAHLMQQHLPHSTLWADAHYQLGRHDPAWQQQRQLAYIAAGDRSTFAAALTNTYPDLAAWLRKNPLRRYASLWRDWAATRIHPAFQDYQRLRSSLWPAIEASPLSYAPPRDYRKLWIGIGIVAAVVFAVVFTLTNNEVPATTSRRDFSYSSPSFQGSPLAFILLLQFFDRFGEFGLRRIDPDHILNRICPPLRTLHDHYQPCPHLLQWLMTDIAILLTLYLTATRYPQTLHDTLTLGTLWLIGRFMQTLWQCKRAITAARPRPPWMDALRDIVNIIMMLLGFLAFPAYVIGKLPLALFILSVTACIVSWPRIPPQEEALRRALFDNGCLAILVSLTFLIAYREPASDLIALLICPLTALSTVYCYRPLPLGARATRIISHLLGILIIASLYLAGSLTLILIALPDSLLEHPLIRIAVVGLPLAAAACKHPQIPPAALMVPLYYLTRALLYLFTAQAAMLIAVALVGITGSAIPAAAFLALVVLHVLASWKAA